MKQAPALSLGNAFKQDEQKGIVTGRHFRATMPLRAVHTHIIGTSGKGKSKLLEHMLRNDLQYENGFMLLDPHGDVYQSTLEFASYYGLDDQIILIDPSDTLYSVGVNYLEYDPHITTPAAHADKVKKAITKAFGDEDLSERPRLDRWLKVTLQTLIAARRPISDYHSLLSVRDPSFRSWLITQLDPTQNDYVIREWQSFAEYKADEQKNILDSVENRLRIFVDDPVLERMFCQPKTTIDFRRAMDDGKAILVNLRKTQALSEEKRNLLGVLLIDKIMDAAELRAVDTPVELRRRFYLYIDEFELFLSEDIARGLKEMRKFELSFILAHQNIDEIKERHRKIYSALGNAKLKVAFGLAREDAEIMAKELFDLSEDTIKDEIFQTKFYPRETVREIEGYSQGEGTSLGNTSGFGHASSMGSTTGMSDGLSIPGMPGVAPTAFAGSMASSMSASGDSWYNAVGEAENEFYSQSRVTVPFYEYEEFQELSSRTYYSVEEKLEQFITWLKEQPTRRAIVKFHGSQLPPLPVLTPEIKPLREDPELLNVFKENIYRQHALPAAEAIQQIRHWQRWTKPADSATKSPASQPEDQANTAQQKQELDDDNPFK